MILLIDNYDSFTFNLYQYLGELGSLPVVVRNDALTVDDVLNMMPEAIIISPGPGRPEHAGICVDIIRALAPSIPILGICLGHQAIGYAFGGKITKAERIMHGKISRLNHSGTSIFAGMPRKMDVMRYHSLVIEKNTVPEQFDVLATSAEDGEIMAIKHKEFPLYGLQFHPESIASREGKQLLNNFLIQMRKENEKHEVLS
ncbi:anthranilate synthase subunit II [Mesobacillus campisalis]|uniref:Anthranilate synthase subunit II n=1 Tax=Mesobacillus campisalis TaxID=1408103 RepID=A0A0M2ST57_9BACI|nr:aminodeoxychorismate/anthranilate synthase component II [Mesobacillus campisalis]KKK37774.1 anthranilate synthase subunit II [Mesobacillus campisalis]